MAAPNPPPLLFDTDVLIDFLRKKPAARSFITDAWANRPALYYSSITVVELYAGIRSGEETALKSLLSSMTSVFLTDSVAESAGDYLRQFRAQGITLSVPDTAIAASPSQSAQNSLR
ncbi:MAG: PIN domain-containing protein [Acidobacteriota bacterium]